jgi:hypothetical protein
MNLYALYKGDKFLTIGTKIQLAEYLNVAISTINFYRSKVYWERTNYNSYIIIDC